MRLQDQPAVLEWFLTEMKPVRRYQPIEITRRRMNFESVSAAALYAATMLPEVARHNTTIDTGGITLHWADIKAISEAAPPQPTN